MSVSVDCIACGNRFRVKDELLGGRARCPKCRRGVQVPASAAAEREAPAPAGSRAAPGWRPAAWLGAGLVALLLISAAILIARSAGKAPAEGSAKEAPGERLDPEARFTPAASSSWPLGSSRVASPKKPPGTAAACTHETYDRLMARLRSESLQAAKEATGRDDVAVVAEALSPYSPMKLFQKLLGVDACHAYMAVLESRAAGERWTVVKDEQGAPLGGLPEAFFWWNVYFDQAEQSDYVSGDDYRPALASLASCYVPGTPAEKQGDVEVLGVNFAGAGNFEATIWRASQGKRHRLEVEDYRTKQWSPLDRERREDLGKELAEKNRKKLIAQLAENDWHVPGGEVEVLDVRGDRDDFRATVRSRATGKRFRVDVKHGRHVWTAPLDEE